MNIYWFGEGYCKIEGEKATVVTNVFDKSVGLSLPRPSADIVLASTPEHAELGTSVKATQGQAFMIDRPGEYEVKDVFVYAINAPTIDSLIFRIEIDGIAIGFFGSVDHVPTSAELERIEGIDIAIMPVGGNGTLTGQQATGLISTIEPRVVIPTHFALDGLKPKRDALKTFCNEIGACPAESINKYKIVKKDLPQDTLQVVVLQP